MYQIKRGKRRIAHRNITATWSDNADQHIQPVSAQEQLKHPLATTTPVVRV